MSSCIGGSPYHHNRVVTSPYNQGTLPTTLIKKPTSRSKPSKQNFTLRASCNKHVLNSSEPVYVWNSRKHIWEQGRIFNRQNPDREPRTYFVEMNGKLYQRTREHLQPKGTSKEPLVPRTENKSVHFSQTTSKTVFGLLWLCVCLKLLNYWLKLKLVCFIFPCCCIIDL